MKTFVISLFCSVGLFSSSFAETNSFATSSTKRMFAAKLDNDGHRLVLVANYSNDKYAKDGYFVTNEDNKTTGRFDLLQKNDLTNLRTVIYAGVFKKRIQEYYFMDELCTGKITIREYTKTDNTKLLSVVFNYDKEQDDVCSLSGKTETYKMLEVDNILQ